MAPVVHCHALTQYSHRSLRLRLLKASTNSRGNEHRTKNAKIRKSMKRGKNQKTLQPTCMCVVLEGRGDCGPWACAPRIFLQTGLKIPVSHMFRPVVSVKLTVAMSSMDT